MRTKRSTPSLFSLSSIALTILATTSYSAISVAAPKKGDISVHFSALTNAYSYSQDDARDALSQDSLSLVSDDNFVGDDTDYLNLSGGLGYYISDDLHLGLYYTSDIELNIFRGASIPFFTNDQSLSIYSAIGELDMLSLDAKYKVAELGSSFDIFVKGGLVLNRLSYEVFPRDPDLTSVETGSTNELGAKLGVGANWHLSESFSLEFGYSHSTFMAVNRTYMAIEYRF
jgi:opacity protein-like surface antigen